MKKITTSDTETIECPACGNPLRDLWELFVGADSSAEVECEKCGRALVIERNVSVDYAATVDDAS